MLPYFRYHPNPLATGIFQKLEKPVRCPCCGRDTFVNYTGPFYSIGKVENLCPDCIASGAAANKYDGEFQDSESADKVSDPRKLDELTRRTPGYRGWQQEYWRAHCDDYCAFLGGVDYYGLVERGILGEVLQDPDLNPDVQKNPQELGNSIYGYLFQCLHCGKHLLHTDYD